MMATPCGLPGWNVPRSRSTLYLPAESDCHGDDGNGNDGGGGGGGSHREERAPGVRTPHAAQRDASDRHTATGDRREGAPARMPRPTLKQPEAATKMTERLARHHRLRGDGGASSDEDLAKQNTDLRQRLHDEASLYRKRLDAYRLAQQSQATLVSRLQAKVLQYKQRCADLEAQVTQADAPPPPPPPAAPGSALEQAQQHLREVREVRDTQHEERVADVAAALARLEEERRRCERLAAQNRQLRGQLEESQATNEDLTDDLQKLTHQFDELRDEMLLKEDEWRDEEQAFNDYYCTEHNRLLGLWRDVVAVKRLFADVQGATERDLGRLRRELEASARDVAVGCGKLAEPRAAQRDAENVELKAQLDALTADLRGKEGRIQQLHADIQLLEDRCSDAEQSAAQLLRLQDEVDLLQNALRDIAHALIQDAEGAHSKDGAELAASHVHLSSGTPVPPKRSARGAPTSAAFAESTISAVQAALHKHQSAIHELQVKLQSNREQCHLLRTQLESAESQRADGEKRLREALAQLDCSRGECSRACQEREALQQQLDALKAERSALDKQRADAAHALDALQADFDKAHKQSLAYQKDVDLLLDEKVYLQTEVERLSQDGSMREMNLRAEEDRCSRMREELLTAREELSKLYLSNDMLAQQKLEGEALAQRLEQAKADLELQLERASGERSAAHEDLVRKETLAAALAMDKRRAQDEARKLEEEKAQLQGQLSDHASDIQSLRKELLQAEQAKLDLDSDKVSLGERVAFLDGEKGKLEMELAHAARDRADLSGQLAALARKRDAVAEELGRTKQKLEQQSETNARVNRNLEALVRESEEKQCALDALDKEVARLQEQLAAARSEKEALEAVLFDAQTNLESCGAQKTQLEHEVQELLVKEAALKGSVQRLQKDVERSERRAQEVRQSLSAQAGSQEAEFQRTLAGLKAQHAESAAQLAEERERVRAELEKRLQRSVHELGAEKDAEIAQLAERLEALQAHAEHLVRQHEELMLRAESDKQQALLMAHHDQQALQERLEQARRELREERDAVERLKRDGNAAFERGRAQANQAKDELSKARARLEAVKGACEEERAQLGAAVEEAQRERDAAAAELQALKVQARVCEERGAALTGQLHDTLRKLKECESVGDGLRKDLTDLRRQLADCSFEKEKYHATNKELRELVKRIEGEKRDQGRQLEEAHQRLAAAEECRGALEGERARLQGVLRDAEREQLQTAGKAQSLLEELQRKEAQGAHAAAEERELQARLLNEAEERERAHQEVHTARKQLAELERGLEQTRKELAAGRAQQARLEEQAHAREQDLLAHLEDCRGREKRLEDQKHNLEVCLADASQQLHELRAKLAAGESRVRAVDGQLAQAEAQRRDVEAKLASVVATLRRFAGIQLDGSVVGGARLMSPSRRWSPARAAADGDKQLDAAADVVDPEAVRKGVRSLMAQVAQVERERDDLKAQVGAARRQLKDAGDGRTKGDAKLAKALRDVRQLQDEKGSLEAQLGQKVIAYGAQADALGKKSDEAQQLRDKLAGAEAALGACRDDRAQAEARCEKLRAHLGKAEAEKRLLQEELGRAEARAAKMELQRMSAEGDLHRLQMMLQERDGAAAKQAEKAEAQARTLASLEERCGSLKATVDQLNQSLEKAANGESELKAELQASQRRLLDSTTQGHAAQERVKHLQKALSHAEHEKQVLAERHEGGQRELGDCRRSKQLLQDQIGRLNDELADCEVQRAGLESQLRLAQWPADASIGGHHEEELLRQLHGVQRERNELRAKIEALSSKVRQVESENRHLERTISKAAPAAYAHPLRSKSYERQAPDKYELDAAASERHSAKLETENRELRARIAKLEAELAAREAEVARLRHQGASGAGGDAERYRAAQLQAERLLEAREQSHRQQVQRLEQQVAALRDQLSQEIRRRQQYVARSSRAGREMQHLRQALGDSLRTVSQDPSLDALLLEQEARKLDHTASASTASLPPGGLTYDSGR